MSAFEVSISDKSEQIHSILSEWRAKALTMSDLHNKNKRFYKYLNYAMAIGTVLLSCVSGALSIAMNEEPDASFLRISAGCMSLVAAGITSLHSYFKIGERQERHDFFEDEYENLAREIRVESLLANTPGKTYRDDAILMKEIREKFDRLTEREPDVPVIKKEKKRKIRRQSNTF